MKLSRLVDPQFQVALRKLAAQELPLRTAFSLRGIIKRCNEELAKYEEVRTDALNKFGDKKEDGSLNANEQGNVTLSEDNAKSFVEELNLLLATDLEVGVIKVSDLGTKAELSANDLLHLDALIAD